jgi:hypothetical protein
MASALSKMSALTIGVPSAAAGLAGYLAYATDWRALYHSLTSQPGAPTRLCVLFFILLNLKSIPLVWTVREPTSHCRFENPGQRYLWQDL